MPASRHEANKAMVLEALDVLFNQRDFAAAEAFWAPDYIQHSAIIAPGRDGLFNLVKALPRLRHEAGFICADGDLVMLHSRYSGNEQPTASVAVDIFRIGNGLLQEHWDVLQDEATRGTSLSGMPMFGDAFPGER
ncbi:nuclear transport factor 2 family protein [Streptomyces sp. NPDC087903]|uniref:nuclear transport factor 2 family protein n=1 Tax=Streptomyces sp. NPDC087903 TaxID=3365819 RepID=UPI00380B3AA3